ncbi:hypothetical protein EYF80_068190 [Liparis tanakae]|uniref:Uncharacterized protein n=1 Tax=Liparis tanakae TaxID=230148 RepID=A0A4Z2DZ18_9TELE|nr:hypothetical protein EYF80_068190 [Liparis tanakae]
MSCGPQGRCQAGRRTDSVRRPAARRGGGAPPDSSGTNEEPDVEEGDGPVSRDSGRRQEHGIELLRKLMKA